MNTRIKSLFHSGIWQGFIFLSPFAVIFLLIAFWQPLFTSYPEKQALKKITGTINTIEKKGANINTTHGNVNVNYDCLCNYGWGEKSFKKGDAVTALVTNTDHEVLDLVILNDHD